MIRYQLNDYADEAWSNEYAMLRVETRADTNTLLTGRTKKHEITISIPNAAIGDDFDSDGRDHCMFSVGNCLYILTWDV